MASSKTRKMIEFVQLIGKLKSTKRTGWINNSVRQPESIADHMYRMSVMSFLVDSKELNKDRCIKLSLVHDMAESIVGDITPADNIPKAEKHSREKSAMEHIQTLLPEEAAQEIYELWLEYENQSTPESHFVKDLDKFDMIMQAYEYEEADTRPRELQQFFDSTEGQFKHPMVQELVEELKRQRDESSVMATKAMKAMKATKGASDKGMK